MPCTTFRSDEAERVAEAELEPWSDSIGDPGDTSLPELRIDLSRAKGEAPGTIRPPADAPSQKKIRISCQKRKCRMPLLVAVEAPP
jgi:hypothetical protein